MQKIIPYGRQSITEEDIKAVVEVLKSDFLTQGPVVEKFEKAFCEYIGCKYAVAVTNGTAALHLAALALNVKPGDKVLCTTNSFVASANCVQYCGGDIEFVDINPHTYCIDFENLEQKLKSSQRGTYKGIIAVDFAGYPLDFEKIRKIATEYDLWIIEDACHALGAEYKDSNQVWQKSGNCAYADIAVFSFHPVKHLATGEGGMITTNNPYLYEKLKLLRTHGITKDPLEMNSCDGGWYYEMQELGFNYRISDILCALGLSQLKRIRENLEQRRILAKRYDLALKGMLLTPEVDSCALHAYHLYVVLVPPGKDRKELYNFLKANNIYAQVHYIPIHKQPFYVKKYGIKNFENAEAYYSQALSLPMYHSLSLGDQEKVITAIRQYFNA